MAACPPEQVACEISPITRENVTFDARLAAAHCGQACDDVGITTAEGVAGRPMETRRCEGSILIHAPRRDVFAFIDDHSRFSSHMNESSWMMGGGRMVVEADAGKGQVVGSRIRLSGRVLGVPLLLEEVVTRREPPAGKEWQIVGAPRLLVIGSYRMAVDITEVPHGSCVRIWIDYELPAGRITYWLGLLLGRLYANWCVGQMLGATAAQFRSRGPSAAALT